MVCLAVLGGLCSRFFRVVCAGLRIGCNAGLRMVPVACGFVLLVKVCRGSPPLPLPFRFLLVVLRIPSVLAVPCVFGNWCWLGSSMWFQGGCFALGEFAMLVMCIDSSD